MRLLQVFCWVAVSFGAAIHATGKGTLAHAPGPYVQNDELLASQPRSRLRDRDSACRMP